MSTDLYIRCIDHEEMSDEVGNAHRDIMRVREDIARRGYLSRLWVLAETAFDIDMYSMDDQRRRVSMYFLVKHPRCRIELFDEYGKYYDLSHTRVKCWATIELDHLVYHCSLDDANTHFYHEVEKEDDNDVKFKVSWRGVKPSMKLTSVVED